MIDSPSPNHNSALNLTKFEDGKAFGSFKVDETLANSYGGLHGGATATLVDIMGSLALMTKNVDKAGVSVDINVTYTSAAPLGTQVEVVGKVLKYGRTMGFTEVDFMNAR